jgi:hypothetical protein
MTRPVTTALDQLLMISVTPGNEAAWLASFPIVVAWLG